LNLFPREKPFVFSGGGYQTLNFIPSIATMVFGLLAGRLLRSDLPITGKLKRLVLFGLAGIVVGAALARLGLCPIVKRIWTPSWAIYSAGWVTLVLAGFVALVEWRRWRRWTFPFVIVGLNPITLYCLWQLTGGFIRDNVRRHVGREVFETLGPAYAPVLERAVVLLVLWLILLWMYRRRIFVRI
jgi:predicted acyltransferase